MRSPGIDEDLAEEIERLLRAGRDHDVVGVGFDASSAMSIRSRSRRPASPCPPPYWRAVEPASVSTAPTTSTIWSTGSASTNGMPPGERDDVGSRRDGEQRANLGRGHALGAAGVPVDESIDGELGHGRETPSVAAVGSRGAARSIASRGRRRRWWWDASAGSGLVAVARACRSIERSRPPRHPLGARRRRR